jgi:hypothetical protein
MLKERAAHLVRVVGDNGVQAWPSAAPMAPGDDGGAAPCLLRSELVARELGCEPAQLGWYAGHANHGAPAAIMMWLSPGRSVIAAIASSRRCA